jgi:hypothetical protein
MKDHKKEFLENEAWMLSVAAAFQHISVYTENSEAKGRKLLREELKKLVQDMVHHQYSQAVSEGKHIKNIDLISTESKLWKRENASFDFTFGVAQKLLNLYLKYLWCLEILQNDPPHFPVDSIIIKELSKEGKTIQMKPLALDKPWSQFENKDIYLEVINYAKALKEKHPTLKTKSLAAIELELYKRR